MEPHLVYIGKANELCRGPLAPCDGPCRCGILCAPQRRCAEVGEDRAAQRDERRAVALGEALDLGLERADLVVPEGGGGRADLLHAASAVAEDVRVDDDGRDAGAVQLAQQQLRRGLARTGRHSAARTKHASDGSVEARTTPRPACTSSSHEVPSCTRPAGDAARSSRSSAERNDSSERPRAARGRVRAARSVSSGGRTARLVYESPPQSSPRCCIEQEWNQEQSSFLAEKDT